MASEPGGTYLAIPNRIPTPRLTARADHRHRLPRLAGSREADSDRGPAWHFRRDLRRVRAALRVLSPRRVAALHGRLLRIRPRIDPRVPASPVPPTSDRVS